MSKEKSKRLQPWLAAALLGLVLALAGCTGTPAGEPENAIERSEMLSSGEFIELNLVMNDSDALTYRWSTSNETELAFDVHSHSSSGGVEYHEQVDASSAEGGFTAPAEGTYSLLWENRGSDAVNLDIHVEGSFRLVSVAP